MQEIRQLTGLRGIAALNVALIHLNFVQYRPFLSFIGFHDAAVDLFFCLSGFTLFMVYGAGTGAKLDVRSYLVARLARVYPLYLLCLVIAGLTFTKWDTHFWSAVYPPSRALPDFIRQVLMVNYWPLIGTGTHWDHPSWSLSVEALCYVLVFPILFIGFRAIEAMQTWVKAAALAMLTFGTFYLYTKYWDPNLLAPSVYEPKSEWNILCAPLRGIFMFSAGAIIYACYKAGDSIATVCGESADALSIVFLIVTVASFLGLLERQWVVVLFPAIVLSLMSGNSHTARFLAWRPVHYFGELSYSIYLIHMLVWHFVGQFMPWATKSDAVRLPVEMAIVLGASALSYHLLEKPARRAIRQIFARSKRTSLSI
ncbi:acyltransferase family protein [Burkholderia multivorans]|uniref:acyltransferase family protein n=1 Tax=Burkholderia multivorans TaxID=87883 RepID=UPI00075EBBCE|nr:acyltransferase [Burkholderia multivorans]KWA36778.1 hypothetical protein WL27_18090 [Burkholderia multivorans]MBJ9621091.1 acyltransferase [Burkholderia multivorans]MBU9556797.1 acyltransferase [Burkholderia multivorans]PRG25868.1 acyltransferase [Burkholderia multivorans]